MNIGTDDGSPFLLPSIPPSIHPSLHPFLPHHLEPASCDTRGKKGVMMKGQGTEETERAKEGTTEDQMKERRKKERMEVVKIDGM